MARLGVLPHVLWQDQTLTLLLVFVFGDAYSLQRIESKKPRNSEAFKDGAGTRNRTRDLLITSQLLYLLSYTGEGRHYSDWLGRVNHP